MRENEGEILVEVDGYYRERESERQREKRNRYVKPDEKEQWNKK